MEQGNTKATQRAGTYFSCPICGEPLEKGEKTCRCPKGHSFDVASEGYVHLLPRNRMHSNLPGDTKEMVAARRRFLESGAYALFSRELNSMVLSSMEHSPCPLLLDTGCGEGYYTGRMADSLKENGFEGKILGYDISKAAVRAAAKRYGKKAEFAVASSFSVPAAEGISGVTVNVFAPVVPGELRRVTAVGGYFILAVPSERHLFGLKQVLYEKPYENQRRDTEYPGFRFLSRKEVRGELTLTEPSLIEDLFSMTPYYWKTPEEGAKRLRELSTLKTEIGFDFLLYRREDEA